MGVARQGAACPQRRGILLSGMARSDRSSQDLASRGGPTDIHATLETFPSLEDLQAGVRHKLGPVAVVGEMNF